MYIHPILINNDLFFLEGVRGAGPDGRTEGNQRAAYNIGEREYLILAFLFAFYVSYIFFVLECKIAHILNLQPLMTQTEVPILSLESLSCGVNKHQKPLGSKKMP